MRLLIDFLRVFSLVEVADKVVERYSLAQFGCPAACAVRGLTETHKSVKKLYGDLKKV